VNINADQIDLLVEFFEALQEFGGTPHLDYSGRGMFGRTCLGVSIRYSHLRVASLAEKLGFEESFGDDSTSVDALGKGLIVYFPGLHLDAEAQAAVLAGIPAEEYDED